MYSIRSLRVDLLFNVTSWCLGKTNITPIDLRVFGIGPMYRFNNGKELGVIIDFTSTRILLSSLIFLITNRIKKAEIYLPYLAGLRLVMPGNPLNVEDTSNLDA